MGDKQSGELSRREVLGMVVGVGGLSLCGDATALLSNTAPGPVFTPSVILGPFYPQIKPSAQDPDLTLLPGKQKRAAGTIIYLTGQVRNLKGEPVRGARVTIWQANTHGRYTHKSDPNTAPLDPNFQGFGSQVTDAEGRYAFKTIKPGAYPAPVVGMRSPHVHFEVEAQYDRLITQMFFPGEALNDQDTFFQFLKAPQKEFVLARPTRSSGVMEPGALSFRWDVVLVSG